MKKGKQHSEETKKKISETMLGHEVKEGTRIKMSKRKLGKKRKPFTEEHKQKLREAQQKRREREKHNKLVMVAALVENQLNFLHQTFLEKIKLAYGIEEKEN